jgi:hypothetical protein
MLSLMAALWTGFRSELGKVNHRGEWECVIMEHDE